MASRLHRLRGRRRPRSRIYIVPAVLIIIVVIAIVSGPFGKDEKPVDINDITPEANTPEVKEKEPDVVKEPEPMPEPLPEPEPEPEPELPVAAPRPDLPGIIPVPDVAPNLEAALLVAEAKALLIEKPGRVIDAREKFGEAFRMPMNNRQRTEVKDLLSDLADKWLFSKTIYPDDKLCGSYKVKPREILETIARRYKVPWEILLKVNKIIRPEALRAGETIKVVNGPFHLKVYRSTFRMDLYLQDKTFVKSFRVGLGKAGHETPTGLWRVKSNGKLIKPPWPDPDTGKMYYPEDPDYPLGSRWIGLDGLEGNAKGRTGFGIHGTKDPEQIGKADSRGCIRMYNGEVILVYNLLVPGISTVRVLE
ncbi:MAG: L,D-transpeptidase family protein [Planctomycetes bacterium]|nr:L,D-transpeptidase family protein [Planctomycetota bacterium]